MRWLVLAVLAVVAAGCGNVHQTADTTVMAKMAKVQTTCAEGINCDATLWPFVRTCWRRRTGKRLSHLLGAESESSESDDRPKDGIRMGARHRPPEAT